MWSVLMSFICRPFVCLWEHFIINSFENGRVLSTFLWLVHAAVFDNFILNLKWMHQQHLWFINANLFKHVCISGNNFYATHPKPHFFWCHFYTFCFSVTFVISRLFASSSYIIVFLSRTVFPVHCWHKIGLFSELYLLTVIYCDQYEFCLNWLTSVAVRIILLGHFK